MKLLFVADGRSPIALNWIEYWITRGDAVHLVSTFTCQPDFPLRSLDIVPVAFSGASPTPKANPDRAKPPGGAAMIGLRATIRHWLGPLTLPRSAHHLAEIIQRVQPDIVHAMRVPYEGMLAAEAMHLLDNNIPLLISIWGNDFTLHAPSSPLMRIHTRRAMQIATALHTDCQRDIILAQKWGFAPEKPSIVLPGNGGLDMGIFYPAPQRENKSLPLVINPRGFRAYVRNDTFFKAIPIVLAEKPTTCFICPNMAGENEAVNWLKRLDIHKNVELLTKQTRHQLADLFRSAQVLVSPSTHDGTPNSLIEGMACGCFPIAGDLDSIREWITPSVNGLLIDPSDPSALAEAILLGLENTELREQAQRQNTAILANRAEYGKCMSAAAEFYQKISQ